MKKRILNIIILAVMSCAPLFGQTEYVSAYGDLSSTQINYWDNSTWAPAITGGPQAADKVKFTITNSANNLTKYMTILESGNLLYGQAVSETNYTREFANLTGGSNKNNDAIIITGGTGALNLSTTLVVKVGNIVTEKMNLRFTNSYNESDTTKMRVEVGSIAMNATTPGNLQFGTVLLAIESVKIGTVNFGSTNGNSKQLLFTNVSSDVEFTGRITNNAGIYLTNNAAKFTKVGGNIIFEAFEDIDGIAGVAFKDLDMSTLKLQDSMTEIIFNDLNLLGDGDHVLMSWMSLSGTATAEDILNSVKESSYGVFRLSDDANSIIFTAIPEPAEIGILIGLLALGYIGYRRRR